MAGLDLAKPGHDGKASMRWQRVAKAPSISLDDIAAWREKT
jgi:hypothetical protein